MTQHIDSSKLVHIVKHSLLPRGPAFSTGLLVHSTCANDSNIGNKTPTVLVDVVFEGDWKNWLFLAWIASFASLGPGKSNPCKHLLLILQEPS